jgi:hypothetical protein
MSDWQLVAKMGDRHVIVPTVGLDDDGNIRMDTRAVILEMDAGFVTDPMPVASLNAHGHGYWEYYSADEDRPSVESLVERVDAELPENPTDLTGKVPRE